jgi:RNA polymerase sigma-70 factor, ECF subfamily
VTALVRMLTDDASLAMPPRPTWFRGRADIGDFLRGGPCAAAGRWRRIATQANGQLAFAVYGPGAEGEAFPAHALEVLTLDGDGRIADITSFQDPAGLERFGLPPALRSARGA